MKINSLLFSEKSFPNVGLLVLRIGIGFMFINHGLPKLLAGTAVWEFLGGQMGIIGIGFGYAFWGFMAALSESLGGLLLIFGLLTRPAAMVMFFTMFMAGLMHLSGGDGLKGSAHAIEMAIVFLFIILAGPGKLSLDHVLARLQKKETA
jgi:putative oxidoreductase